jgi:hypothetical protein
MIMMFWYQMDDLLSPNHFGVSNPDHENWIKLGDKVDKGGDAPKLPGD